VTTVPGGPGGPAWPPDPLAVHPLEHPPDATVAVPGSKSLTNRALIAAGLARGASTLTGALRADDTEAMLGCLGALGVSTAVDWGPGDRLGRIDVHGSGGRIAGGGPPLDARLSGTTSRFVLPVAALADDPVRIDGAAPLRARPMGPTLDALRELGVAVAEHGEAGHLPVTVQGPLTGGELTVPGDASSQFLSGLLLAGPATLEGLVLELDGPLVSRPYVDMTVAVMRAFGAEVHHPDDRTWVAAPGGYRSTGYVVEPDASAASYLFAAAAISGGRVTVEGLGDRSVQGDVAFVDLLEAMGAEVERTAERTTVTGTGALRGVEVDMADISDTAQTLAAVAVFADSPTRITGIGFIRHKETDRIAAVVTELGRCGIDARAEADGFVVHPGDPVPATVATYDDHRMAMAFALLGLRAQGIRIADPGCVAKTFPGYWETLASLGARLGRE
jgi:3-phosphoshikimate 1-carboxyvinyltransferase